MKSIPSKKHAQRTAARKTASPKPGAATKKTAPRGSRAGTAVKAVPPAAVRREPPDDQVVTGLDASPGSLSRAILEEVRALRAAVLDVVRMPSGTGDAGGDLESTVDSMRRLLSEWMERRADRLLEELAAIRDTIADPDRVDRADGLRRIDRLFERLGATPFTVRNLDFVDPAIHEIVAERSLPNVPDGVVVETLRPGLRGSGGLLVCKARVAVNRRATHEPAGH